ncbi:hypothetical protein HBI23_257010 [Parastagonospora nodorum]|nr:hypothetical protein HBI23_257010 [Parastagonospora nodorum]
MKHSIALEAGEITLFLVATILPRSFVGTIFLDSALISIVSAIAFNANIRLGQRHTSDEAGHVSETDVGIRLVLVRTDV